MSDPLPAESRAVPFDDVVRFVRQLSHDLRNHLNAVELQSAFLSELATDAEMKDEIKRLRGMIAELGNALQKLSSALAEPKANLMPYRATDLVEDIRRKFEKEFPDRTAVVQWEVKASDAMLNVDPQLLPQAILELFDNAFRHRDKETVMTLAARMENDRFLIKLREPKARFDSATKDWGRHPFRHVSHAHYGLGLNRVSAIAGANGGDFRAEYDATQSELVSTIVLPVSPAGS